MRLGSLVATACLIFVGLTSVYAAPEIMVGDMDRPLHKWGSQSLNVPVTSNADYPKFIVVQANLKFQGSYLNPKRGWRSNHIIMPGESVIVGVPVDIPPNYGTAAFSLVVYDVVDTLDPLLPSQKIMEQAAQMLFRIPEGMIPYMQDRITVTPMVDNNMYMGTEFARALTVMIRQKKSIDEIAKLAEVTPDYVKSIEDTLAAWAFYGKSKADGSVVTAFPTLLAKEADGIRPLVDKASTDLAALIAKNIPTYWKTIDSMIKGGGLVKDSNDFINGGTCLYRLYPVVTALFLWNNLGQGIVGGTHPLDVYRDSDPCHAYVTQYLYAIQGGDLVNGNQFYDYSTNTGRSVILFGDKIPVINCPDNFPWKPRLIYGIDYDIVMEDRPEIFTYDTTLTNPALRALGSGVAPVLKPHLDAFKAAMDKLGPDMYTQGSMLWYWNQVASRTTKKLIDQKVLTRRNNGQFRFESLNGLDMK